MGVVQRQIEAQGVSTVSISLYRGFTEKVRPPRALWVPFPFGRPLGAPNNRDIQRKVIFAALELLRRERGPVLEDLALSAAEDHLDARHQSPAKKCGAKGCSLEAMGLDDEAGPAPAAAGPEEAPEIPPYGGSVERVLAEIASLREDHRTYLERSAGRTQVGHSGVAPGEVGVAALRIDQYVRRQPVAVPDSHRARTGDQVGLNLFIRLCADDLKAYFLEAKAVQGGIDAENAADANFWFWYETEAGRLIVAARDRVVETTDRAVDPNWMLARAMVPRGYGRSGYTMHSQNRVETRS